MKKLPIYTSIFALFAGASSVAFAKENVTVDISNENYVVSQNTSLVASKGINASGVVFDSSTFSNNTLTSGVNESIYGGIMGGNVTLNNTSFSGNSITHYYSGTKAIYGGIVYLSSEGQITGGEFVNNQVKSEYHIAGGIVGLNTHSTSLTLNGTLFSENSVSVYGQKAYKARGGAIANYNKVAVINSATFVNNTLSTDSAEAGQGGAAIYSRNISSSSYTTIVDTTFTGNRANTTGGAIVLEGGNITISAKTKSIVNTGNVATNASGVATDALGGFMYMGNYNNQYASKATFDVASGLSITIGDGTAKQDSIAGDSSSIINKVGAGALIVNGSMEYYKGVLNVNEGSMAVNSVLGASDIVVASGATLTLGDNADIILYGCSITLAEGATLALGANSNIIVNLEEDFTGTTSLFNIADGAVLTQDGESVSLSGLEDNITVTYNGVELDESRWSIDATTGQLVANVAVPEPAEWAMILGALALGIAIYRRRK